MSDEPLKPKSKAVEESIFNLKNQGFSPSDAMNILLCSAINVAQLASTMTKEDFLQATAETWDGLASMPTSEGPSGHGNVH